MSDTRPIRGAAIITGSSDGIGRSLAKAFARRGFAVGLLARREDQLARTAEECRALGAPQSEWRPVDVTDSERLRAALRELDERLGGATHFIANAGIGKDFAPDVDSAFEGRKTLLVNAVAAIDGLELMKRRMLDRGRGGTLAGVSSIAGIRGLPTSALYSASKAALSTYLEAIRIELKPSGIRVCDIAPGFVATPLTRDAGFPMPFIISSDTAAEIFVRGLLRGRPVIIAPWQFRPISQLLRHMPLWLYSLAASAMIPSSDKKGP